MEYTKGEIAGGWVYINKGKTPIALVHPKYVDKFLAAPDMYEALKEICRTYRVEPDSKPESWDVRGSHGWAVVVKALAKAKGKE